jgi:hypothetical protein
MPMDNNEIWARIIAVGERVKQALVARRLTHEEWEAGRTDMIWEGKGGRAPFWSSKRGFKYIDDVEDHLRRVFKAFDLLNPDPGSSVFEIGPGTCYFLVLCRGLRGCRVNGVDWIENDAADGEQGMRMPYHELQKHAFGLFRTHFGLESAVRHQVVKAYEPIAFGGGHDAIVATRAMFNHGWGKGEYRYWLNDCFRHLNPGGKLMVHLNNIDPEPLALFPFLRPQPGTEGNKKLCVIPRDVIGRVFQDRT